MEGLELLRAVRKQITEHPETHHQAEWGAKLSCGTTHCVAGWALALSGVPMKWVVRSGETTEVVLELPDGRYPDRVASDLMDLDEKEGARIFYAMEEDRALTYLDEAIALREGQVA